MDTPPVVTSRSHFSNADFNAAVKLLRSSFATPASVASKPFDLSSVIRVVLLLSLMCPSFSFSPGSWSSLPKET